MVSSERRRNIQNILRTAKAPIKGTDLAEKFGVSRQIIVQDIAILRASGENIIATPKGYIVHAGLQPSVLVKTLVCTHQTFEEIEEELSTIVDFGGKIIDVVINHPLYGEKRGALMISSGKDVREFMNSLRKGGAQPLSLLTGGVHLHTVEVMNEESFNKIREALDKKGYLVKV